MAIKLKIGIANRGVLHHNSETNVSLEDWFKEVSQSKAFDYVDKTPSKEDFNQFQKYSEMACSKNSRGVSLPEKKPMRERTHSLKACKIKGLVPN